MGVTRKVLEPGNGKQKPIKGDVVSLIYTGNIYDEAKGKQGKQLVPIYDPRQWEILTEFASARFDSSKDHGDIFEIPIGVGTAIKG